MSAYTLAFVLMELFYNGKLWKGEHYTQSDCNYGKTDYDDRRNRILFEDAFYSGTGKDPTKQETEPQPETAPVAEVSLDTATLLKFLQNPKMAAL